MKISYFIWIILCLIEFGHLSAQINIMDSTYIYDENGNKEWFNVQDNVFCFSLNDNSKYTNALPPCVDTIVYYNNSFTQFNEIRFKSTSIVSARLNCVNNIINQSNFGIPAVALSKNGVFNNKPFFLTDDLLMIAFVNPNISETEISQFMHDYELEKVFTPYEELPQEYEWAYTFRLLPSKKDRYRTSIQLAQFLNEEKTTLIKYADPNTFTVYLTNCETVDEMNSLYSNTMGTWFIHNDGSPIWQGNSGTQGADTHICECWGEGATGQGVKIGVIDHYGFQTSHPDFLNSNIPHAYNVGTFPNGMVSNIIFNNETTSHSMMVTGLIAAQPNNLVNNDGNAVGGAYDATVIPYLCGIPSDNVSNREVIHRAILKAIGDKCDILNMSLNIALPGTLSTDIYNAVVTGRPDPQNPNIKRGMVVVAGTGNGNYEFGTPASQGATTPFPANQSETIGVGWSDPNDFRASPNPPANNISWGLTNTGSNYGNSTLHFDVVAPGIQLLTTDLINSSNNGYTIQRGASLSTPLVSSIAALILQKRPDLTYQQVKEVIKQGADKVHPEYYTYTNGYNKEMFFGRVNCINSLNIAKTLGTNRLGNISPIIKDFENGIFIIEIPDNQNNLRIKIYDLMGKEILHDKYNSDLYQIDLTKNQKGIYILKIFDNIGNNFSTKLIR